MPLESEPQPLRPKQVLHIPTPLIGAAVALALVLWFTVKAYTDRLLWLGVMLAIPAGIYLLSHPAVFLGLVLVGSSARIWLPFLPLDLPLDLLLRAALVAAIVAGAILRRDVRRPRCLYRFAAMALMALVLLTMYRKGSGFYQLGGALWGGKAYIILLTNLAFIVLIPGAITMSRRAWMWVLSLALLAPMAVVLADALYVFSGGRFYHLYFMFRPTSTVGLTAFELTQQDAGLWRLSSFSQLKLSWLAMLFMPALIRTPQGWLAAGALLLLQLLLTALSGFRGALMMTFVYVAIYLFLAFPRQRRRLLALGLAVAGAGLVACYALAPRLPAPVQRAVSWLPGISVDARIALDAQSSSNWRLDLWTLVWDREVPKHWLFGKGLAYHPAALVDTSEMGPDYWLEIHNFIVTNDYHNGPLVALVAFGVAGLLLLLTLFFGGVRRGFQLYQREWGDAWLRNAFLLTFALYLGGVAGFLLIFGDLQNTLQQLLTHLAIMELLAASDPRLSAPPPTPSVRRLVNRPRPPARPISLSHV
jgi:hypothetical protein